MRRKDEKVAWVINQLIFTVNILSLRFLTSFFLQNADMQYYSFYTEAEIEPLAGKLLEAVRTATSARQPVL